MYYRIETTLKQQYPDPLGGKVQSSVHNDLNLDIPEIRACKVLGLLGNFSEEEARLVATELFCDPIVEDLSFAGDLDYLSHSAEATHAVEVSFLSGVTDNTARSAKESIEYLLNRDLSEHDHVFSSTVYLINANKLNENDFHRICEEILYNSVIEKIEVLTIEDYQQGKRFTPFEAPPEIPTPATKDIAIAQLDKDELVKLSSKMCLALSREEMLAIQEHYQTDITISHREKLGLPLEPTDVELEAIAQTWSEHCKHKIFAANVKYEDESGQVESIQSLFKTMIYEPTAEIMKKRDDISSVFSDNAGAFHFDDNWDICIKAETHNSPSALDPYGGAMTGIVGVNRDVMGTGRGFLPIFNTDVFCFGPPNYDGDLPGMLHHPKRIFRGVHRGVKDGGNESGIPTVNGSISFDDRFIGKPLVFCGTGGIAPRDLHEKPVVEKWINPGDRVVMLGGLIGKDGIHGATFSSEGLSSASPTSAVQIGDPITQKRMTDFLIEARTRNLYNFITDNGAGGLSSSLGEMAEECGGVELDLTNAPLKYPGLAPWEIFLSEAQERMSLAVPPEKLDTFMELAEDMKVIATDLGQFDDTGFLNIFHGGKQVASLCMDFLHNGLPTLELKAKWTPPQNPEASDADLPELCQDLAEKVISRYNICSKEDWVRQYDHEVQGMSVIKPFSGIKHDAPSDAAVIRPDYKTNKGLAISHGLLPRYSDIDTYHMTCNVFDEAIRSIVCVGGDRSSALGLDNFCWPDPVQSSKTPDGTYKMAQLVRANKALRDMALKYNVPCISGKDSMKNDFISEDKKISIPPTLLFTAVGTVPEITKSISMDFKKAGDVIILLGETKDELGASEFYDEIGYLGMNIPQVDTSSALERYDSFFKASQDSLISSAHDLSEGGLLVALAESCFGARMGANITLPKNGLNIIRNLFSESASRILVSVQADKVNEFKAHFEGQSFAILGEVSQEYKLNINESSLNLQGLYTAWRNPIAEI
ncbi:MAG: phosphoribosylformylglycinamidine synthase [Planctomycetes bacterium]|nr:phosphoribosylformylglycinamidine synthase [Planctomycetota bacterium]